MLDTVQNNHRNDIVKMQDGALDLNAPLKEIKDDSDYGTFGKTVLVDKEGMELDDKEMRGKSPGTIQFSKQVSSIRPGVLYAVLDGI